ncbi:MAG: preprotein translocase subunit SecG [Bdellovibrionales bacterium]|nr:preprotein translocase subunit SecG [Bdellovibrionales bacterium]
MTTFVTVVHIVTCFLIVVVVLMQSGKGADISASLGGSSNTVFGSSGGANFFTKTTFVLAAIFMVTSLGLTVLGGREKRSVFDTAPATSVPATSTNSAPANTGAPASTTETAPKAATETKTDTKPEAKTEAKAPSAAEPAKKAN